MFLDEGFSNLYSAFSSDKAIQILKERKDEIKLIITDINRPGGNGLEFIKYLSHNHNYIVGIIILTMVDKNRIFPFVEDFDKFKDELNPINIVGLQYIMSPK